MFMRRLTILSAVVAALLAANSASAACMNRFVSRTERPHQIVTLLTGKLTFQEAQDLAKAIASRQAPPIEWLGEGDKVIARQMGPLKVVRPMPVACDGKASGVVMIVTFPTGVTPSKKMLVRINADTTVEFEQQAD